MTERLARVPAWAWLAAIVGLSWLLRLWLVRGMAAPFIFVDELIYTELARSLADTGSFAVRGTAVSGYSILYPALLAPVYGTFDNLVDAYAAAKATNAIVMSLAAIPTYLLARRVAGERLALLGAAIAVVVPSMAYTGTITTESLFYPVALGLAFVLVRYLERPGWRWLAALVAALAIAFATRSQSLAFVPAIATAPLLLALLRSRWSALRPFVPLYVLGAAAAIALVVLQAARGRSLTDLLGAYSIVGEGGYDAGQVLRFWLWHVEELDLYVGIVPFAALLLALLVGRTLPDRLQEHVAATTALVVWSTLAVGAFASRFASDRVQDRYLFFLAPLLVVVVLAWVELGAPRPRVPTLAAAAIALALVLVFPYVRFIGEPAKSDTLGLVPLWTINEHLVAGRYWATVARRRRRAARALPARPRAVRRRRADRPPRALRRPVAAGLVGPARLRGGGNRRAAAGQSRPPARLDRPRGARRGRGRRALDRPRRPVHGQHERVLQPARRAGLLHRPADARRFRRDPGDATRRTARARASSSTRTARWSRCRTRSSTAP